MDRKDIQPRVLRHGMEQGSVTRFDGERNPPPGTTGPQSFQPLVERLGAGRQRSRLNLFDPL